MAVCSLPPSHSSSELLHQEEIQGSFQTVSSEPLIWPPRIHPVLPTTCSRSSSNNPTTSPRLPFRGSTSTPLPECGGCSATECTLFGLGVPPSCSFQTSRPPHHRHKARAAHTTGSAVCFLRLDNQFSLRGRSQDAGKPNGHQLTQKPGTLLRDGIMEDKSFCTVYF